jgi:hypothetical protein
VLVLLLVGTFVVGGTGLGAWLLAHPRVLIGLSTVAALSFYSLRVVL